MALTAIVKPRHDCNLACAYCYVEAGAEKGIMTSEILTNFLESFAEASKGRRANIIWHGGEPLLMSKGFYEEARYAQWFLEKKYDCRFSNSFQSNATLFDEEWAEFLKRSNFSIGFSLDGPKELNDLTRKYKNGKGAYDEIKKGLDIARKTGFGDGFIVVINKNNVSFPEKIYNFLKENNYGAKLNPLIRAGRAKENIQDLGITPKEYSDFMIKIFDLYFNDQEFKRHLDPFDSIMGNVAVGTQDGICSFSDGCQERFFSVGPRGDIYPCGRFDGIKDFWMGNVNSSSLNEILNGPVRKNLQKRKLENMSSCTPCEYKKICNGGCMSNGYMTNGNFMDKDYYCPSYKKMFEHISGVVDKELEKAEVKI